jgi:hypothetical protein
VIAKIIKDPKEIFATYTRDCQAAFGDDLVSIVLYGSAAGDQYRPGKSDLNFMIVLSDRGIERLERGLAMVETWRRRQVAVPLFVTAAYVAGSLDVFPIEYLNIQRRYLLVYGRDILADLSFEPKWLRLQCEREVKSKLILLRELFFETGGRSKALRNAAIQSLPAVAAICEALLHLHDNGRTETQGSVFQAVSRLFDLDEGVFERLLDIKTGQFKPSAREMGVFYHQYLAQVAKLAQAVDAMGG